MKIDGWKMKIPFEMVPVVGTSYIVFWRVNHCLDLLSFWMVGRYHTLDGNNPGTVGLHKQCWAKMEDSSFLTAK